ncbi:MAG: alpha/beta hydrolase [Myxococcales bacterium]
MRASREAWRGPWPTPAIRSTTRSAARAPPPWCSSTGGPGTTRFWKHQLDAFPGMRVIAIDLPGNGRSSRRTDAAYTMELFADAVHEVLTAERVPSAFLVGHSMGFSVVEVFAAKYPQLCAGIASVDGAHFEVSSDPAGQAQWRQETEAMAAGMTTEKAREDFLAMLFLADSPALLKDEVLAASRTVPLEIGRAMIAGVAADLKYWLPKKVDLPCLAVYSPAYQLPPSYPSDFARTFPRVEFHQIGDVSHFFMLEVPYQLNQLLADFVARHRPPLIPPSQTDARD